MGFIQQSELYGQTCATLQVCVVRGAGAGFTHKHSLIPESKLWSLSSRRKNLPQRKQGAGLHVRVLCMCVRVCFLPREESRAPHIHYIRFTHKKQPVYLKHNNTTNIS